MAQAHAMMKSPLASGPNASPGVRFRWSHELPEKLPATPLSHFQTRPWVELLRRYGQVPLCLIADCDGVTLATWVLYLTPSDYLQPPRRSVVRRLDRHLRAVHGPVLREGLSETERGQLARLVLLEAHDRARNIRPMTVALTLDPIMTSDELESWRRRAQEVGWLTKPSHTYCAVLADNTGEAFSRLKPDRRTKIRKAERLGVECTHGDDLATLLEYAEVRSDTRLRNGQAPVPWQHFADTWHTLRGTDIYHVFLAKQGNRVGAGQIAFVWNGYVHLSGVSVATWAIEERVPANDLLQWSVLRWAIENGQRVADFAGAQPTTQDPKIRAIDSFKSRWGTEIFESVTLCQPPSRARARLTRVVGRLLGE